jgi:hypothetical protein
MATAASTRWRSKPAASSCHTPMMKPACPSTRTAQAS